MLRIKFFAMALVVGLAGVVYAAGDMQDAAQHQHQHHGAQTAGKADCCKTGQHKDGQKDAHHAAMSCDGEGCCKGHKAGAAQASAKAEGESCCAGGGSCCGDGCCKGKEKSGAAVVKTGATGDAASCCGDGAACCKDGAACCKAHKPAAQAAGTDEKKHEGCCGCCGDSCEKHAGR